MITKETTIEELVEKIPQAISYLMEKNIRCIRCGEPIWGTLAEAAVEKGYKETEIENFVKELNTFINHPQEKGANKENKMSADEHTFNLSLTQKKEYEFVANFDWDVAPILFDEPDPLGGKKGPNASRVLGAAIGNCLSASLYFCLSKSHVTVNNIETEVQGFVSRNEKRRMRVSGFDVTLHVDFGEEQPERAGRCLSLFEDFCVVSASVRQGIPMNVTVVDKMGTKLYEKHDRI